MSKPTKRPVFWKQKWVINPFFQLKFCSIVIGLVALGQATLYTIITSSNDGIMDMLKSIKGGQSDIYVRALMEQHDLAKEMFITTSIWFVGIVIVITLLLSHRIAGPIYRLCVELRDMADSKKLHEIEFRKTDSFQEIPDAFNHMLKEVDRTTSSATPSV